MTTPRPTRWQWPPVPSVITGAIASYVPFICAQLASAAETPIVIVCATRDEALRLAAHIEWWQGVAKAASAPGAVIALCAPSGSPYLEMAPHPGDDAAFMAALAAAGKAVAGDIVVLDTTTLVHKTLTPAALAAQCATLAVGETLSRDQLIARLASGGYQRAAVVDDVGTFAVRGGIVDIFAPTSTRPLRVEFFGDEVESLRTFDPLTQRTVATLTQATLSPAREAIVTDADGVKARLYELADAMVFPSRKTRELVRLIEEDPGFVGNHALLPAYHASLTEVASHLPPRARLAIVDEQACAAAIERRLANLHAEHQERVASGHLAFPPLAHVADEAWWQAWRARAGVAIEPFMLVGDKRPVLAAAVDDLSAFRRAMIGARTQGSLAATWQAQAQTWRTLGAEVMLVGESTSRLERLRGLVADATAGSAPTGIAAAHVGPIEEGFSSPRDGLVVVTAQDALGDKRPTRARRDGGAAARALRGRIDSFLGLAAGSYLVHRVHGVGRYQGLVNLPLGDGAPPTDFLHLVYANGSVYLPVYRISEVERYVGADASPPKLDKLGGETWAKSRHKASLQVRALAEELLQLYAQRAALAGHAFGPADDLFRSFEDAFPYQPTPDQQTAIDAVLADMERPRPMDRLIYGDVGYGKTEVALRAICRAATDGKQVALLAPTTVLVEQHMRTITERFAAVPVTIAKLSRFQSKRQQDEVVAGIATGAIDIVVGTHRMLSADVRFPRLGLVVIDEEQRFGVEHKEKLKRLRTYVDVLTLTATPIPRTLHVALAGLRDMSIIATPPETRQAIRTYIAQPDPALIRDAIRRELARGGQVFWVAPHIDARSSAGASAAAKPSPKGAPTLAGEPFDRGIEAWQAYLQVLVPEARIAVAHGQLTSEALERTMVGFIQGEFDILCATSIIESGIDIPRANTMFVARADRFGLAQLYQLRGRIGRSDQKAQCYLLVPPTGQLTEQARKRLETLERHSDLGAGFHIAAADLEQRGGGELFGPKQSGAIAAVGFDAYVRLLEEAVAELRGEPLASALDPDVTTDIPCFLPDDYLPDVGQRLDLYRRLATAASGAEVQELLDETVDRFGVLPAPAVALGQLMQARALARDRRIGLVDVSAKRLAIAYAAASSPHDSPPPTPPPPWKRTADGRFTLPLSGDDPLGQARQALLELPA
ncbi:MAG: transcription-repair coupling factor [Myxococcales bacterium]|nr:transcription-repair coupling factor [Myxococcales bacterium]